MCYEKLKELNKPVYILENGELKLFSGAIHNDTIVEEESEERLS